MRVTKYAMVVMLAACAGASTESSNPGGNGGSMNGGGSGMTPDARRPSDGGSSTGGPDGGSAANCGGVSEGGLCNGTQVSFCEAGMLEQFDCGSIGAMCECDAEGWCDCTGGEALDGGVAGGGDCGGVTEGGECDGTQLAYCEEGSLVEVDCAAVGATSCMCDAMGWCDCM